MKKAFHYSLTALGHMPSGGYNRATPELPGRKSTINTFGFTGQPLVAGSLKDLLTVFAKITGVELSYSRVYREITQQGVSSSVVPAWPALQHAVLVASTVAVVLISRVEVPLVQQK